MNKFLLISGILCYFAFYAHTQNAIKINKWVSGVAIPVDISHCGDDRLFVVEKQGRIRIIKDNALTKDTFLNITSKVRSNGNEQGFLGLAFHPNHKNNGLIYVNYTGTGNPTETIIEEYKLSSDTNRIDPASGRVLLRIVQPFSNHNGGCIKFGMDGYLYIGMGDGGSANDPQNYSQKKTSMLGKMLRIDVDTAISYKIPKDNPFVGDPAYLPEIWSLGLRNPWRFSVDRMTGDFWIGDVGQGSWEEVDFEAYDDPGGKNYGWRCYEGNANFNLSGCGPKTNYTFPLHEYFSDQNINGCSITGGFVYRGNRFPGLYGKYIYGDYCTGKFWIIEKKENNTYTNTLAYDFTNNALTTFGEDAEGNLYFADAASSSIYQILDTCTLSLSVETRDETCFGKNDGSATTTLSSISGTEFMWTTGDTTPTIMDLAPGNYGVSVRLGDCLVTENFSIVEGQQDSSCIDGLMMRFVCEGDSIELVACNAANAGEYIWAKDGIDSSFFGKSIWVTEGGHYSVRVLDVDGCLSMYSPAVTVAILSKPAKPELDLSKDSLSTNNGYLEYKWYLDGQFIGSGTKNYWKALVEGNYQVELVDSNGCVSDLSEPVLYMVSGLEEGSSNALDFKVQPNPANEFLLLEGKFHGNTTVQWEILDVKGVVLLTGLLNNQLNVNILNIQSLNFGPHFIRLKSSSSEWTKLFIKQ